MGPGQLPLEAEAFIKWVVRTKKIITNPRSAEAEQQLIECNQNKALNKEFAVIFKYLQNMPGMKNEYLKEGKYDFSEDKFKGFLDYLAINKLGKEEGAGELEINSEVYSAIFKDWKDKNLSFNTLNAIKSYPIHTAVSVNNLEFAVALNKANPLSFLELNKNGLSPIVQLVDQISEGTSKTGDLQSWIDQGLPLSARCSVKHQFCSAAEFANRKDLQDVKKMLSGKYTPIAQNSESFVEYKDDIEINTGLFEALKKYLSAFNENYDFNSVLKILSPEEKSEPVYFQNQTININGVKYNVRVNMVALKPIYSSEDFKRDFSDVNNLQHFIDFIRSDKELDSSLADQLEQQSGISEENEIQDPDKLLQMITLINYVKADKKSGLGDQLEKWLEEQQTKSAKCASQDPNQSLQLIDEKQGELLKKYLVQFIKEKPDCASFAQICMNKLNEGKFNEINLNDEIYKFLLNYCVLNMNDTEEDIALFESMLGKVGLKGLKYDKGDTKFDGKTIHMTSDMSPLGIATQFKSDIAVKLSCILVKHGYGVSELDATGHTAVHLAAGAGNIKLLEELAKIPEVNFNQKAQDGSVPIIQPLVQCSQGKKAEQLPIIKALVDGGADVNYVDSENGQTILHLFVEHGLLESLIVAKEFGANFDLQNAAGVTLLDHARTYDNMDVTNFIIMSRAADSCNPELLEAFASVLGISIADLFAAAPVPEVSDTGGVSSAVNDTDDGGPSVPVVGDIAAAAGGSSSVMAGDNEW